MQSVYGFVWLDFGLDIVLRFSMLAYNAVEWGSGSLRLVAQPVMTVNLTLEYCALFWLLVALAYGVAVRRHGSGPLGLARAFNPDFAYAAAVPVSLAASVVFYLTAVPGRLPLVLVTPLALLAEPIHGAGGHRLVGPLPPSRSRMAHWQHSSGGVTARPGARRVQSLPREPGAHHPHSLDCGMFAGKRPSLAKMVPFGLACLLLLSTVVSSYRLIKWQNVRPEEVARGLAEGGISGWLSGTSDGTVRRFHAFDSMLLTVALVPALEPHSGRNVLLSPLLRGVVPRFLYSGKSGADAGINFGSRIWAYDDQTSRESSGASIAPSMPGDLYDAGGVLYIALGALIFGTLLGLVDGWKSHLPPYCAAAVTVLVATQCAMSVERDFDNSIATFIQTLLVFVLVSRSGCHGPPSRGGLFSRAQSRTGAHLEIS